MSQNALIFLHISKTGGTTLRSIIEKQYLPETIYDIDPSYFVSNPDLYQEVITERIGKLEAMSDEEKRRIRCIFHPTSYGIHEILPQTSRYVTLLRDPIDHYISNFYFAYNRPSHSLHQEIMSKGITLDTFHEHFGVDNVQTRRISAYEPIDSFHRVHSVLPDDALEQAKKNLKDGIAIVGLLDQFDESVLLMQEEFGWKNVTYLTRNVASKRKGVDDISDSLRESLAALLAPDIALYKYAVELFEEQVAKQNQAQWQKKVKNFQQQQENYSRVIGIKRTIVRYMKRIGIHRNRTSII